MQWAAGGSLSPTWVPVCAGVGVPAGITSSITGPYLVQPQQQDVVSQPFLHQLLKQFPTLRADGRPAGAAAGAARRARPACLWRQRRRGNRRL